MPWDDGTRHTSAHVSPSCRGMAKWTQKRSALKKLNSSRPFRPWVARYAKYTSHSRCYTRWCSPCWVGVGWATGLGRLIVEQAVAYSQRNNLSLFVAHAFTKRL